MPRKRQTKVGRVNPIDVRNKNDVSAFESLLGRGPLTIVLVYADWCGHCQTFKQNMWNEVSAMPNKKVNTASVHYDMVDNTSLKNAKIEGYPSLLLVGTNKEPAIFKENGSETNAIPTPRSVNELKSMVNTPVSSPVSNANTVLNTVLSNTNNVGSVNTNTNMNTNTNVNTNVDVNTTNTNMNTNVNTNTNTNMNSMINNDVYTNSPPNSAKTVNSYAPADPTTIQVPDMSVDYPKTATVLPQVETGQKGGQRGGTTSLMQTLLHITAQAGHAGGLLLAATEYADLAKRFSRKMKKRGKKRGKTAKRR